MKNNKILNPLIFETAEEQYLKFNINNKPQSIDELLSSSVLSDSIRIWPSLWLAHYPTLVKTYCLKEQVGFDKSSFRLEPQFDPNKLLPILYNGQNPAADTEDTYPKIKAFKAVRVGQNRPPRVA